MVLRDVGDLVFRVAMQVTIPRHQRRDMAGTQGEIHIGKFDVRAEGISPLHGRHIEPENSERLPEGNT
jgi:hypothetical protein